MQFIWNIPSILNMLQFLRVGVLGMYYETILFIICFFIYHLYGAEPTELNLKVWG